MKNCSARVKYSQGITLSKNYQSFRAEAGVELDCDSEDIEKTFDRARKLVVQQLKQSATKNHNVDISVLDDGD